MSIHNNSEPNFIFSSFWKLFKWYCLAFWQPKCVHLTADLWNRLFLKTRKVCPLLHPCIIKSLPFCRAQCGQNCTCLRLPAVGFIYNFFGYFLLSTSSILEWWLLSVFIQIHSFTNDYFKRISTWFQHDFKICLLWFLLKEDCSFAEMRWMFISSTAIWVTSSDTGSVASRARRQLTGMN